ncbi:MAG: hypothetical protein IT427_17955 [Pirellulales bacterium]|nr:hypothetical protein [Pirellulales bacterium]
MRTPENQVEQIVQEVLARLGRQRDGKVIGPNSTINELAIDEAVVTATLLAGKLHDIRRLVVSPRAVITPAARDLLKENNVALVRSLRTATPTEIRIALATAGTQFDVSAIVQSLRTHRADVVQLVSTGVVQVTNDLAEEVGKSGKLGVFITPQRAQALCLANRRCGIRAAMAGSRGEVFDIIKTVGANFMIVDPTQRNKIEVQRIVEAFCLAGQRNCPEELRD